MKRYINQTPCVTSSLKYSDRLSEDGDWTGSFWTGMVAMAFAVTGDEGYFDYINGFYDFYKKRLDYGYKDHDLGFLYQLYSVNAYRMTNHMKYIDMSVDAAKALMCRYNERGGFIRAWDRLIKANCNGKIIIDCMLNLPLLFCAAQMSGLDYMRKAAYNHALATLNNVREDGSAYHTFNFDYVTGKPLNGENEGGYSDNSCWSRGQAWGIYGFYLAWFHTGEEKFLSASMKLADYFIKNLGENSMPKWDFLLDENAPGKDAIDTSAAAIAACGLYDLAKVCVDKSEIYRKTADDMLKSLITGYSRTFDEDSEVLLEKCYCGGFQDGKRAVNQWSAIFGDYYYMEAITRLLNKDWIRYW